MKFQAIMSLVSGITQRIETMDRKKRNSAIALIVFGISLFTFTLDYYEQDWLVVVRTLQLVATAALLFAIFKRDELHKDKLILFWLLISATQCSIWIYYGFHFMHRRYYYYSSFMSIWIVICCWFAAVCVGYMVYLMYQEYCRLIQSPHNVPHTNPEVIETKEMPPPYMAPTSESSAIAILSPVMEV